MQLPPNRFKQALAQGRQQLGLWCGLPDPYATEVVAGAGFDWLGLDTEHAPGDVSTVLAQLQVIAAYGVSPVVRPPSDDPVLIKQYLDVGAQTLLLPYIESAAQAQAVVTATRYPPVGIRGMAGLTRATRFGRVEGYAGRAAAELCVLVQVESARALDELAAIAGVEGVDGVFVGPADLAASLGYPGEPGHPAVIAAVEDAIRGIVAAGKPAGILTTDEAFARRCMQLGTTFTAVGIDLAVLARGTEALAARLRPAASG